MQMTKVLGLAAVGAMLVLIAPSERANALSLSNPGAATAVQEDIKPETTEVGWRHRHHAGIVIITTAGTTIIITGAAGKC